MSKTGRNDPCYCGSGKKYKKCCLSKDEEKILEEMKEAEPWEDEEDSIVWPDIADEKEVLDEEYGDTDDDNSSIPLAKRDDEDFSSGKDSPYPTISKDEEEIVDEWWDVYKKMDDNPDKIHRHLQQFMDKHPPEMVENLGMEHEILFELGAAYFRADRHEEYIQLLKEIRKKYPEVYRRSAGYYDSDIIAWLIANKQNDKIYDYLDYFEKFPADFVDKLFGVTDLLQATDNTQSLLALTKKVHQKVTTSPKVIGGQEIIFPLMTHIMSKFLQPGITEAALEQMLKELTEELGNHAFEGINFWKHRFDQIFRPFALWDESIPPKKSQLEEKYRAISFNYSRYLHEHKNISWISAHYYSQLILKYFFEYLDLSKNKPKTLFNFTRNMVDKIGSHIAGNFIYPDFFKVATVLNSIWYFQEYLHLCGNVVESQRKTFQEDCAGIYNGTYSVWRKKEIEALCFPKFPFWE